MGVPPPHYGVEGVQSRYRGGLEELANIRSSCQCTALPPSNLRLTAYGLRLTAYGLRTENNCRESEKDRRECTCNRNILRTVTRSMRGSHYTNEYIGNNYTNITPITNIIVEISYILPTLVYIIFHMASLQVIIRVCLRLVPLVRQVNK